MNFEENNIITYYEAELLVFWLVLNFWLFKSTGSFYSTMTVFRYKQNNNFLVKDFLFQIPDLIMALGVFGMQKLCL